jgi:hypothetical protein
MVSYHGTRFREAFGNGGQDIANDLNAKFDNMKFGDLSCPAHEGFKKEYESSKASLYEILNKRENKNEVDFTGHSLGGAAAGLATLDAATNHPEIENRKLSKFWLPKVSFPRICQCI